MNVERLAKEYTRYKDHLVALTAKTEQIKDLLSKEVDNKGEPDENGHVWLPAGGYMLKREKRQPKKYLDRPAAEAWAKEEGFWEQVSVTPDPILDLDALDAYVYEHRDDSSVEEAYQALHVTPEPTWAFIRPMVQDQIEY